MLQLGAVRAAHEPPGSPSHRGASVRKAPLRIKAAGPETRSEHAKQANWVRSEGKLGAGCAQHVAAHSRRLVAHRVKRQKAGAEASSAQEGFKGVPQAPQHAGRAARAHTTRRQDL